MLRTGKEHLESLRDGRVIYIGSERVDDVTHHPAFRNAATTVALGTAFYLRFSHSRDANWRGGILFDDWVRENTRVAGQSNRRMVATFTDAAFYGAMGYRLIDTVFVPGLAEGSFPRQIVEK